MKVQWEFKYLTVLQNMGLNTSLLTSMQIQNKRTEAPCHSASRDGVMLPPCDVCEDGLSRARLSLICWFCCIVTESSKDTRDSCHGTSNRSPTAGASMQTASVISAVEMVGLILLLLLKETSQLVNRLARYLFICLFVASQSAGGGDQCNGGF